MDPAALSAQLRRRARPETVHTSDDLQQNQESYADASYWHDRYATQDAAFEWLCGWRQLAPLWRRRVGAARRVLHAGCGTSTVGADLGAVNVDVAPECVEAMRRRRPDGDWRVADCLDLPFAQNSFDAVLDKGTLDAFCCDRDAKQAARRAEQYVRGVFRVLRPGGVLFVVSFSETRLRHLQRVPWAAHTVDTLRNERNQAVYVYVLRKPRRRRFLLGAVLAALAYAMHRHVKTRAVVAAEDLEPTAGAAQCNYELLKSFTRVAAGLDWTLGAGTLLGALRSEPAGLLPWEHDVDVYIPARDAAALAERLQKCAPGRRDAAACGALLWRGFVDGRGDECCGFGYKAFHATSTACELDVLVLAAASYAPWTHGKRFGWTSWPPFPRVVAAFSHEAGPLDYLVIPEDVDRGNLLQGDRWDAAGRFRGPEVAFFQDEYFGPGEFLPREALAMYDLEVFVPHDAWASLNRTYGPSCSYTARVDEHGGVYVDLRRPEHAHLKRPAEITIVDVFGNNN